MRKKKNQKKVSKMAILKMRKIKELSRKDLDDKLRELELELTKEIGFSEIGTVKNPGRVGEIRRTIARIKTHKRSMEKK
jgi:large subunit ribosomal protein L29